MFCQKCGTKNDETAVFCSKCGADLKKEAAASVTQTQSPVTGITKKKSKKIPIILAAVIIVIVAIYMMTNSSGVDYEATVRTFAPLQGVPHTYGNVLSKYIVSPQWSVRREGDTRYVNISGTIKGTNSRMVVTIRAVPDLNDPGMVIITPERVTMDGMLTTSSDQAGEVLMDMFVAYDEGWDDISHFLNP